MSACRVRLVDELVHFTSSIHLSIISHSFRQSFHPLVIHSSLRPLLSGLPFHQFIVFFLRVVILRRSSIIHFSRKSSSLFPLANGFHLCQGRPTHLSQ